MDGPKDTKFKIRKWEGFPSNGTIRTIWSQVIGHPCLIPWFPGPWYPIPRSNKLFEIFYLYFYFLYLISLTLQKDQITRSECDPFGTINGLVTSLNSDQ